MLLGGALWILYGPFTMLQPWAADVVYRDSVGYSVVVDAAVFVVYSLPGSLAVVLTASGLLGLASQFRPGSRGKARTMSGLVYTAVGLGLISLVGVISLFDPIFTAGRIFGTLSLSLALLMAARAAHTGHAEDAWLVALTIVGLIGLFLLPVWPLVYALRWLNEGLGAFSIAAFGIGWMILGWRFWAAPPEHGKRHTAEP